MTDIIESRVIEHDGIKYKVQVMSDRDSSPDDADCYSDGDKQAWRDYRWTYVGIVVTVADVGDESRADLWGIEWGEFGDQYLDLDHYLTTIDMISTDLLTGRTHESTKVSELMDEARSNARDYRDRLNAMTL